MPLRSELSDCPELVRMPPAWPQQRIPARASERQGQTALGSDGLDVGGLHGIGMITKVPRPMPKSAVATASYPFMRLPYDLVVGSGVRQLRIRDQPPD